MQFYDYFIFLSMYTSKYAVYFASVITSALVRLATSLSLHFIHWFFFQFDICIIMPRLYFLSNMAYYWVEVIRCLATEITNILKIALNHPLRVILGQQYIRSTNLIQQCNEVSWRGHSSNVKKIWNFRNFCG